MWTASDDDAVQALIRAERKANPDLHRATAYSRAHRRYFLLTGKVKNHGTTGSVSGCRCRTCWSARAEVNARYQGRLTDPT